MPRDNKINSVLIIGSGPIIIGQACEFDYSGSQASRSLREEGIEVTLINSNPATIMTDEVTANNIYLKPLVKQSIIEILEIHDIDAVLPTMGGQTALNLAIECENSKIWEKYKVKMIGVNVDAINTTEDRELFRLKMNDFRITVWGLGKHARTRIIPALSFLKEFSLVGVCSRTEKVVKACAEELDCDGWIDPEIMLGSNKVDIVYISTPIGVHFKLAKMALEAKKHVWCEKPLTCNYNHTKKLIDLAEKNKKMLNEAFMFLYHPQFIKIQNLIKNKELGDVHSVVCRFGIPTLDEPGFRNSAELCGGALWDVASYTVAAVLELFYDQNVQVLFS